MLLCPGRTCGDPSSRTGGPVLRVALV